MWFMVLVPLLAGAVVVAMTRQVEAAAVTLSVVSGSDQVTLEVERGATVAGVLDQAGLQVADGRLLSVATATVLQVDHDPGVVRLDGRVVDETATIDEGVKVLEVVDGTDEIESVRIEEVELPATPGPAILRTVEERGAPGRARNAVGVISGEIESSETIVEPRAPAPTARKVVSLTFDDGPSSSWTPYVLAILASRNVKATFCMVGTAIDKNPEMAKQVLDAGHQICNHTRTHDEGLASAAQDRVDAELAGGRSTIIDHGLGEPGFYRPPGGYLSDTVVATATGQGERVLMWKVDTKDWQRSATTESVLTNLRAQVAPGAIILLHDGGGANRHVSIAVLGPLIDELRAQGYEFTFPIIDPV